MLVLWELITLLFQIKNQNKILSIIIKILSVFPIFDKGMGSDLELKLLYVGRETLKLINNIILEIKRAYFIGISLKNNFIIYVHFIIKPFSYQIFYVSNWIYIIILYY